MVKGGFRDMARGKILAIVGISGTGKTTLAEDAASRSYVNPASGKSYKVGVLNSGTVMNELVTKKNPGLDVDKMRYALNFSESKKYQELVAKKVAKAAKNYDLLLLTTHAYAPTYYEECATPAAAKSSCGCYYVPSFTKDTLRHFKNQLYGIVNVVAPAEDLARRRREDASRTRDEKPLDEIRRELCFERDAAISASMLGSAFYKEISNPDGKEKAASAELESLVRNVLVREK